MSGVEEAQTGRTQPAPRAEDFERIERGLKRGPDSLGNHTGLWTPAQVAHLMEQECSIDYHPGDVWRILRRSGWSCRRPSEGGAET